MNSLKNRLSELLATDVDLEVAVRRVLAEATREELEEAHYPLLVEAGYKIRRDRQRDNEDEYFSGENPTESTGESSGGASSPRVPARGREPRGDERLGFLSKLTGTFTLKKRTIPWIEATIEQHEEYMVLIRTAMRGLEVNIERHSRAVRICREYGKNSLQEVAALGVDIDTLMHDSLDEDWEETASEKVMT